MKKKIVIIVVLILSFITCLGIIYYNQKAKEREEKNDKVQEELENNERIKYFEENYESMKEIVNESEKYVRVFDAEVSAYLVNGILTLDTEGNKVIENDKKLLGNIANMLNNGIASISFKVDSGKLSCTFHLNSEDGYGHSYQYNLTEGIATFATHLKGNWYLVKVYYE